MLFGISIAMIVSILIIDVHVICQTNSLLVYDGFLVGFWSFNEPNLLPAVHVNKQLFVALDGYFICQS